MSRKTDEELFAEVGIELPSGGDTEEGASETPEPSSSGTSDTASGGSQQQKGMTREEQSVKDRLYAELQKKDREIAELKAREAARDEVSKLVTTRQNENLTPDQKRIALIKEAGLENELAELSRRYKAISEEHDEQTARETLKDAEYSLMSKAEIILRYKAIDAKIKAFEDKRNEEENAARIEKLLAKQKYSGHEKLEALTIAILKNDFEIDPENPESFKSLSNRQINTLITEAKNKASAKLDRLQGPRQTNNTNFADTSHTSSNLPKSSAKNPHPANSPEYFRWERNKALQHVVKQREMRGQ